MNNFLIQQNVVPSTYEHLLQSAYVAQKHWQIFCL